MVVAARRWLLEGSDQGLEGILSPDHLYSLPDSPRMHEWTRAKVQNGGERGPAGGGETLSVWWVAVGGQTLLFRQNEIWLEGKSRMEEAVWGIEDHL